jgi:hypothetical protein
MAEATVALQQVNEAAFRPLVPRVPPQGAAHDTKTTMNHQRFVTPVKIEFNVPTSQNAFNLAKAHQEILKLMKDKDPTLEIIPSKEGKEKFSDLLKFPANKTAYNALFVHAVDKQPTEARKIIVKHSLFTAMTFCGGVCGQHRCCSKQCHTEIHNKRIGAGVADRCATLGEAFVYLRRKARTQ